MTTSQSSKPRVVRRLCVAALAVVTSLLIVPDRASSTEAMSRRIQTKTYFGVDLRAHQFNMCRVACSATGPNARAMVIYWKGVDGPWTISVNEACATDIGYISSQIGMGAYVFYSDTYVGGCPGPDKRFGNAVFTLGTVQSAVSQQFATQSTSPCTPGPNECRGAVCVGQTNPYFGQTASCSAHLTHTAVATAQAQASQYISFVNSYYSNMGRWVAGDFNLIPSQITTAITGSFYRAPQASTYPASSPNKQIDYVWHDTAHSAFNTLQTPDCNTSYSNHCHVRARFG